VTVLRHKFTPEECRRGGQTTVERYGTAHMQDIGKRGFWAMLEAVAERQWDTLGVTGSNPFRNILRNLKAKKGGR